ncbi:cytochrome c oxidase subunit 3 [Anaeromyxobacter diazotrophicus]|uniref:Bb3-type cytochrome oxidase subunit IV n=1 Tax=Anaeromyxobacter diazotrophicus TaxID=2590199 RepID=A0A7I9VK90_9BACT|nr:cytochrome c oxidase subunit 3 [Anaeromyxobacter diazotrophicus]GEJ56785.1 bb3-type cytochrome oxidase subunit IV [Anaeromyxobacter diazotrophicus]
MSQGIAHHAPAAAWPPDAQYGAATPGKIGMWIFLVSDAFSFGGLLLAYGILRTSAHAWRAPGEPALGLSFTAGLTILLIATSVTNVFAHAAAVEGRRRAAALLLGVTALGGALFLLGQYQEWFGLWGHGLVREGLVFGHSARASTFYIITGYHGLHVLVGVVYMLAVLGRYVRGEAGAHDVEILGLYWCFVDFVWVFVFSFLYLFP